MFELLFLKSIIDASAWFQMMQDFVTEQHHHISAVFTDNPTIDEKTLKKIFGEKIAVLKDIFHLIQGLFKICKQTAKHKVNWEDAVARLFWLFSSEDIDREKRRELERGQDKEFVEEKFCNFVFLKNNPRVRHYLNSPTSILEGLKRLRDDFEKLGVFISNSYQVFVNAYAILEKILLMYQLILTFP